MKLEYWIQVLVGIATVGVSGLTVWAILRGPIKALEVQRKLDEERDARQRKLSIFKTLMTYRATVLAPEFVQALNMIELEFDAPKEKHIRDAWKELLDHFVNWKSGSQAEEITSRERAADLTTELLHKMGLSLGYDFDKVYIKKGAYRPKFLGNIEDELHAIRRGILGLLGGQTKLPVAIFEQKFQEIVIEPDQTAKKIGDGDHDN